MLVIKLGDKFEHLLPAVATDAGGIRKEEHRIARRLKGHSLILGRQKSRAPQAAVKGLHILLVSGPECRVEYDEVRKIAVERAQTVAQPSTQARFTLDLRTRTHLSLAFIVIDRFGMHRLDKAQFVRDS